jgi:hypothetical protein
MPQNLAGLAANGLVDWPVWYTRVRQKQYLDAVSTHGQGHTSKWPCCEEHRLSDSKGETFFERGDHLSESVLRRLRLTPEEMRNREKGTGPDLVIESDTRTLKDEPARMVKVEMVTNDERGVNGVDQNIGGMRNGRGKRADWLVDV